jgi:hypothetical protein
VGTGGQSTFSNGRGHRVNEPVLLWAGGYYGGTRLVCSVLQASLGRPSPFRALGGALTLSGVGIDWSFIATTGGAVATTLLGVVAGSVVSSRAQRTQRSWERQTDACAQVLRESAAILIALSQLAREARGQPTGEPAGAVATIDWRPWNDALAMVSLVADHEIAHAAHAIDDQIWRSHIALVREVSTQQHWFELRDLVEERRRSFTEVARRRLAVPGPVPRRLHGRPGPHDPVWSLPERPPATPDNC